MPAPIQWRGWCRYVAGEVAVQFHALLPVATFLFAIYCVVLRRLPHDALAIAAALLAVSIGLALFMFGLFHGLLPLGKRLGTSLPYELSAPCIFVVALLLGVTVTYAEPALNVTRSLSALVLPGQAPYVAWLLSSDGKGYLMFAVAAGVGLAVMIGMLRIYYNWRLSPILCVVTGATLTTTLYVELFTDRAEAISLAWDLGAITTGPVTVPMVLAIGMGLTRGLGRAPSPSDSFGVVSLASLVPVITVLLLALWIPNHPKVPRIRDQGGEGDEVLAMSEIAKAVWHATQALTPLLLLVFVLLRLVLKQPVFKQQIVVRPTNHSVSGEEYDRLLGAESVPRIGCIHSLTAVWGGLVLFEIGLNHGLNVLGDKAGAALPALFTWVPALPGSPLLHGAPGIFLAVLAAFLLGFGATIAEPALRALAVTVEGLTEGRLTIVQLIFSVSLGVGMGVAVGILKLVYHLPLAPLLVALYSLTLVLTLVSDETTACIAWDCAGVTTDAITVPLVLSLGLGFGGSLLDSDGFGLLALASVCPIISVLLCNIAADMMRRQTAAKGSRPCTPLAAPERL
jgi:hypothetical protein